MMTSNLLRIKGKAEPGDAVTLIDNNEAGHGDCGDPVLGVVVESADGWLTVQAAGEVLLRSHCCAESWADALVVTGRGDVQRASYGQMGRGLGIGQDEESGLLRVML